MSTDAGGTGFLTRRGAVPVAFASVVGAGIIGVPAAVYHRTGSAALVTWLVAVVLCLPMIVLFRDTVRFATGHDPLRETVRRGLGEVGANAVPLAFALVVMVGLPTNAMVAAHMLARATGHRAWAAPIAALLLALALVVNLVGGRAGGRVQAYGAAALVVALAVVVGWALVRSDRTPDLLPDPGAIATVPTGVLVAFWAFVGFENLTFLTGDLRHPRRDFLPVCLTALGMLVTVAALLTVAMAVRIAPGDADPLTGLVQAVRGGAAGRMVAFVLAVAGVLSVTLNAIAWLRGVGLVIDGVAREGLLPAALVSRSRRAPARALLLIGGGSAVTLTVLGARPSLVVGALASASGVFVIIYLGCIAAYLRVRGLCGRSLANLALVPLLVACLVGSGWRATYAAIVLVVVCGYAVTRRSRLRVTPGGAATRVGRRRSGRAAQASAAARRRRVRAARRP